MNEANRNRTDSILKKIRYFLHILKIIVICFILLFTIKVGEIIYRNAVFYNERTMLTEHFEDYGYKFQIRPHINEHAAPRELQNGTHFLVSSKYVDSRVQYDCYFFTSKRKAKKAYKKLDDDNNILISKTIFIPIHTNEHSELALQNVKEEVDGDD